MNTADVNGLPYCIGTSVATLPAYPTAQIDLTTDPTRGCDYKIGTGVVNAENLKWFCDGSGGGGGCNDPNGEPCPDVSISTETVVPGDGDPIPNNINRPPFSEYIGNANPIGYSASPLRVADDPNGRMLKLFGFGAIGAGRRIRASLAYNSCPGASPTVAQSVYASPLVVNFDLALCGTPTGSTATALECEFISESLDDTNEGFDVTLSTYYDDLNIYLLMPGTWEECDSVNGGGTGQLSTGEDFAWAGAIWW